MSIKPRSVPTKTLAQNLSSSGTTLYLNNTLDWDGNQLTGADFGTQAFATLRNATNTKIEFIEIDPSTITPASAITILKRGLGYDGTRVAGTETQYNWSAFDTYVEIGADTPALLSGYAGLDNNNSFTGVNTFTQPPTVPTPVNNTDAANKQWVLGVVSGGNVSVSQVVMAGTCGENVSIGNLLYLKAADGKWWKADVNSAATLNNVQLGIAQGAGVANGPITGGVLIRGIDTNQSGGVAGAIGYASNTPGGISTSAGTVEKAVGNFINATQFAFDPVFYYNPTSAQKAAMSGTGGVVSSTNKFVTEDGAQVVQSRLTEETSSGISAGVPVFIKSNGEATKTATVKSFIASGKMEFSERVTGATADSILFVSIAWLTENKFVVTYSNYAPSGSAYYVYASVGTVGDDGEISIWSSKLITSGTYRQPSHLIRLSDNKFVMSYANTSNNQISVLVGSIDNDNIITVGTVDTTSTSNASSSTSLARLSDSSFVLGYVTPSSAFDATIKAATVSGNTITFGSPVTVDTTNSSYVRLCGLSSNTGIVSWSVAGSSKVQQFSVSGTTITLGASSYSVSTANRPVLLATLSSTSFALAYNDSDSTGNVRVRVATVSGDIITLGNSIVVDSYTNSSYGTYDITTFGKNFIVSYIRNNDNTSYNYHFAHITVSGTTATLSNKVFVSDLSQGPSESAVTDNRPTINLVNGYVLVLSKSSQYFFPTITSFKPIFNEVYMGIAKSAPVSNVVPIIQKGRTGSLYSGLTFGKRYLFNQDGTISENGVIPGGQAISTTELLIS